MSRHGHRTLAFIDRLPGRFKGYDKMVTSRISLEDVVAKGFEELVNNRDEHIKIMISPKLKQAE